MQKGMFRKYFLWHYYFYSTDLFTSRTEAALFRFESSVAADIWAKVCSARATNSISQKTFFGERKSEKISTFFLNEFFVWRTWAWKCWNWKWRVHVSRNFRQKSGEKRIGKLQSFILCLKRWSCQHLTILFLIEPAPSAQWHQTQNKLVYEDNRSWRNI